MGTKVLHGGKSDSDNSNHYKSVIHAAFSYFPLQLTPMQILYLSLLATISASPCFAGSLDCLSTRGHFNGREVSVHRTVEAADRPGWIVLHGVYDEKSLPTIELLCRSIPNALHCRGSHYGGNFFVTIGRGWMTEFVGRKGEEIAQLSYACSGTLTIRWLPTPEARR